MNAAYVAVVDDEAPVRTALGRLLRLADYEVAAFACGEEFLESLAARRPDCVVLDVHMPRLTGFDVQAKMRAASVLASMNRRGRRVVPVCCVNPSAATRCSLRWSRPVDRAATVAE
jgi:CheY-like chemotaxis protein